jgi:hypothetical protein
MKSKFNIEIVSSNDTSHLPPGEWVRWDDVKKIIECAEVVANQYKHYLGASVVGDLNVAIYRLVKTFGDSK